MGFAAIEFESAPRSRAPVEFELELKSVPIELECAIPRGKKFKLFCLDSLKNYLAPYAYNSIL